MQLTTEIKQQRKKGIGGSDVAAILGFSPWKTKIQLFKEKTSEETCFNEEQTLPQRLGHLLEPFVAELYCEKYPVSLNACPEMQYHKDYDFIFGNYDFWIDNKNILECKTANQFAINQWGNTFNEIPLYYQTQCIHYSLISDCEYVDIAVLIGNMNFLTYRYYKNEKLEKKILNAEVQFWEQHVLTGICPEPTTVDECKSIFKKAMAKTTVANNAVYTHYLDLTETQNKIKVLERQLDEQKAALMNFMKEDDVLISTAGEILCTWKSTKASNRFDTAEFKKEHPDLYKEFTKPVDGYRRFIVKTTSED